MLYNQYNKHRMEVVGNGFTTGPINDHHEKTGITYNETKGLTDQLLWEAMYQFVINPEMFTDVTDVYCEQREKFIYREMTMEGEVIRQHIYLDEIYKDIKFVRLDVDGKEIDEMIVKSLCVNPLRFECFKAKRTTREKIWWDTPKEHVKRNTDQVIKYALELYRHELNYNHKNERNRTFTTAKHLDVFSRFP